MSSGNMSLPKRQVSRNTDPGVEEVDEDTEQQYPMMPHMQPATGGPDQNQLKMGSDNPAPTGIMAWAGFGCSVFALACLCIAFASPYWMQTYPNSFNSFKNIGLWEVCMENYMHYKDDSQEVYSECWWVFNGNERYKKLREWLLPPWFITCQVMAVGCLVLEIAVVILAGCVFLHFCPILNHEYFQVYGMFVAAAMMFLVAMITFVAATVFGVMCQDWQWMPRPDMNFLSWGFGFFIISGIVVIVAGACFFLEANKVYNELLRREEEYTKMHMEMSGYGPSMGYAPSGFAPSVGYSQGYPPSQGGYAPSQGYAPSTASYPPGYNGYGDKKSYGDPSYGQQPSYEGGQSYGQPSYDRSSYGSQEKGGHGYDARA